MVSEVAFYHRPLDVKKLVQVGFWSQGKLTMKTTLKLYELPSETRTKGLRKLELRDVPAACALLNACLAKRSVATMFSEEDFQYKFLSDGNQFLFSYVVESDSDSNQITEFFSFYSLSSTLLKCKTELKSAYMYYHTLTCEAMMTDVLILAKQMKFDMFNMAGVIGTSKFVTPLKFRQGNGVLRYYLYNWQCPIVKPDDLGVILV
jgi:glycylpeptide N-tetradecanoyltransferase